ncbi:hypothetical protein NHQ30_008951 [Ciborinia camelliae]|nr:hypothetical protein NHQ30_008951 [Ciborinia camelliae]
MATKHILASATQNAHLLSILSRTDHAPSEYAQVKQYQLSLEDIISREAQRVRALTARSAKEYQDHEEYQDSTVKRLAYKLSGRKHKFVEKEEQEHREWLNAIQNELEAKRHFAHLSNTLQEARSRASSLKPLVEEHHAAQVELDNLYHSIFSGPSSEFPTEDSKEHLLSRAKDSFEEGQSRLLTESHVLSILQNASTFMNQCMKSLNDALKSSTMDALGVDRGFVDMTERSSLALAQSLSSRVEMLVCQARRMQPAVQPLGPMKIAQGNIMSDVLFDNTLSDLKFQKKIEESKRQVVAAQTRLIQETMHSSERLMNLREEVKERKKDLEGKRRELQDERAALFEKVINSREINSHEINSREISDASQELQNNVQIEYDNSEFQSQSLQWDGKQLIHDSLFGRGYHEQELSPYHIPPAGTYNF